MNYYNKLGFNNLTEVQDKIQSINKNTLILSSCGSGKTEASYFKMLEYEKKTIFIEPMKTLATSIQDRLNKYNKQLGLSKVSIQHSSNAEDKFLDNKYCVTTIDQILSGYLGMGRQSFIKGKNVLLSNLIFDEVQLFDTEKMLLTTINMLDEIHKIKNKFIIMTATMPQYLIDFLKDRYDMEVIITESERNERKTKLYYKELNYEDINTYDNKQIIICNTTKQLMEIYNNLDKDRTIVLHSKFTKSDRKRIENDVNKYFGKESPKNNKILLTTQIVEAGMDISSNRLYSARCPIDNLVQRDGRCCRWGGEGEVIVFPSDDKIYDIDICENTINNISNNQGINFTWKIQKQWINDILNPFYKQRINKINIKRNKLDFKTNKRSKLIRDIENVNVIVSNNTVPNKDDFKRESISIHINNIKEISENNDLYIINKNKINKINYNNLDIGDTVVIQGIKCKYDKLGFRFGENEQSPTFPIDNANKNIVYDDYVEETWLEHAISVRDKLKHNLLKDKFNTYIIENIEDISFYGGLHDIGKLDVEWLRKSPNKHIPLAHFPFTTIKTDKRTHDYSGAYILKQIINNDLIFNMILQHHRKVNCNDNIPIEVTRYNLHKDTNNILHTYGLNEEIKLNGDSKLIHQKDIITPSSNQWTAFLYLVGTLMESEIEAIKQHIQNSKESLNVA